jgi:ribosome-binding factor A
MSPQPQSRRVDELVREALALTLIEDVTDPRVELVTVTGVDVSRDRRHAKVFVTAHGGQERYEEALAGLKSATGRIKSGLARRVRLRYTPELHFAIDHSVDAGMRISEVLRNTPATNPDEVVGP